MNRTINITAKNFTLPEVVFLERVCETIEKNLKNKDVHSNATEMARSFLKECEENLQKAFFEVIKTYDEVTSENKNEIGSLLNEIRGSYFSYGEIPLLLASIILENVFHDIDVYTRNMLSKEYFSFEEDNSQKFSELTHQEKLVHMIIELDALNSIILPKIGQKEQSFKTAPGSEKLNCEYVFYADPFSNARLFNELFKTFKDTFNNSKDGSLIENIANKRFIEKIFETKNIADDFLAQETSPSMNS